MNKRTRKRINKIGKVVLAGKYNPSIAVYETTVKEAKLALAEKMLGLLCDRYDELPAVLDLALGYSPDYPNLQLTAAGLIRLLEADIYHLAVDDMEPIDAD